MLINLRFLLVFPLLFMTMFLAEMLHDGHFSWGVAAFGAVVYGFYIDYCLRVDTDERLHRILYCIGAIIIGIIVGVT